MAQHLFKFPDSMKHPYTKSLNASDSFKHVRVDATQLEHYFPHELKNADSHIHASLFDYVMEEFYGTQIPNKSILQHWVPYKYYNMYKGGTSLEGLFMIDPLTRKNEVQVIRGQSIPITYRLDKPGKYKTRQLGVLSELYLPIENAHLRNKGSFAMAEEFLLQLAYFVANNSFSHFHSMTQSKLQKQLLAVQKPWNLDAVDVDADVYNFFNLRL